MYSLNLKHIKEVKQLLTRQQISNLEEYLITLYPNSTISIDDLSFRIQTKEENIEKILIALSEAYILDTVFIIRCDTQDFDYIHTFKFESFPELLSFVKKSENICPDCSSQLLEENTEVFFKIPNAPIKKVNTNE